MLDLNIRSMTLLETFETFIAEYDEEDDKEIGELIIYGIQIKFSLFDYIKGRRNIKEKSKTGKTIINNKVYRNIEFDMEIARREKLMKRYLIEKLENKPIVTIRGGK